MSQDKKINTYIWQISDYLLMPFLIIVLSPHFFSGSLIPWDEGMHSSSANLLLHGNQLYRDLWFQYPPFFTYILAVAFKIFGATLEIQREFFDALIISGALISFFSLRVFLKNRVIIYFVTFLLLLDFQIVRPRVLIGIAGLAFTFSFIKSLKKLPAFFSGITGGIILFTSQDSAVSFLFSLFALFFICFFIRREHIDKRFFTGIKLFFTGFFLVVSIPSAYFAINGSFINFIKMYIQFPYYFSKGFCGLPFLTPLDIINSGENITKILFSSFPYYYIPIIIYSVALTFLIVKWVAGKNDEYSIKIILLLAFGCVLFRSSLGRSDIHHVKYCTAPAIFLYAIFFDMIVGKYRNLKYCSLSGRLSYKLNLLFVLFLSSVFIIYLFFIYGYPRYLDYQYSKKVNAKYVYANLKRAGKVRLPSKQVKKIEDVTSYILKSTDSSEKIFIFPHQPIYYFLADRLNSTSFDLCELAFTPQLRNLAVKQLNENKPAIVVYAIDQEIDGIAMEEYAPEIAEYLFENYKIINSIGNILFLREMDEQSKLDPFKKLKIGFLIQTNARGRRGPFFYSILNKEISGFNEYLKKFPKNLKCRNYIGILYAIKGDVTTSFLQWKKCLEIDPDFTPAIENLKRLNIR